MDEAMYCKGLFPKVGWLLLWCYYNLVAIIPLKALSSATSPLLLTQPPYPSTQYSHPPPWWLPLSCGPTATIFEMYETCTIITLHQHSPIPTVAEKQAVLFQGTGVLPPMAKSCGNPPSPTPPSPNNPTKKRQTVNHRRCWCGKGQ